MSIPLPAPAATDSTRFRLHKFEQPIGYETDTVSRQGEAFQTDSEFEFTDRGRKVPLKATFRYSENYAPLFLSLSGSTSRMSTIDLAIRINGRSAAITEAKKSRDAALPERFFPIAGYAPAGLQEALLRYWRHNGKPAQLAILPSGSVQITERGKDTLRVGGSPVQMQRYIVRGLVWGLETLWMDDQDRLAAVVTRDSEFDHFEAIREEYESGLSDFISAGARDEIDALEEMNKGLPGRRTGVLAITGATLIDGLGGAPIRPATIVTRNGKIAAAGPAASTPIPADAERVDATGKFVIPGLWDMHAHYEQVEWGPIYLAAGVTTVRDVGNEFDFITAIRDANNSGRGLGPRLLLAGVVDGDGPIALGVGRVNSPADVEHWVKKYHDAGFQQIKIYSSVKPDIVKAICADAHALGMTVTGHIPVGMSILDGVAAGMDQVNHISFATSALLPPGLDMRKATPEQRMKATESIDPDSEAGRHLIATLKEHNTVIDDTAALYELGSKGTEDSGKPVEPGIVNLAPELRQIFEGFMAPSPLGKLQWTKTLELIGALHRAGIRLVAGTDQAVPGYSVYREMEIYVEAGFTPMEALQAATIVPARAMHISGSGSIAAGNRADFDILDANPLEDIHQIRRVRWVVANGTLYDPTPLWRSVGFLPPHP